MKLDSPNLTLAELQEKVQELHQDRGYRTSIQTLLCGVVEEVGELAQEVLLHYTADYVPSPRKRDRISAPSNVPHEVGDIITYLLGLCNALDVEPVFEWSESPEVKEEDFD